MTWIEAKNQSLYYASSLLQLVESEHKHLLDCGGILIKDFGKIFYLNCTLT